MYSWLALRLKNETNDGTVQDKQRDQGYVDRDTKSEGLLILT
jgi:hypothetical protein